MDIASSVAAQPLFSIMGLPITESVIWSWVIMGLLLIMAVLAGRNLQEKPKGLQNFFEMFIELIEGLLKGMMGPEAGPKYLTFVGSLALFVMISNVITLIPGTKCPTADLNTTLGLGLLVALVAHGSGVVSQGPWGYIKSMMDPYPFMLPLNLVGELGKLLSHSFRLFGNMAGGGILVLVVMSFCTAIMPAASAVEQGGMTPSQLFLVVLWSVLGLIFMIRGPRWILSWKGKEASGLKKVFSFLGIGMIYIVFLGFSFPTALTLWFGFIAGLIQAFIFFMLAMAYTSVARG